MLRRQKGGGMAFVLLAVVGGAALAAGLFLIGAGTRGATDALHVVDPPPLKIIDARGRLADGEVHEAVLLVTLAQGVPPLDLGRVALRVTAGSTTAAYTWSDGDDLRLDDAPRNGTFGLRYLRAASVVSSPPVYIASGDLVEARFVLPSPLGPGEALHVLLAPPRGAALDAAFKVPAALTGVDTVLVRG